MKKLLTLILLVLAAACSTEQQDPGQGAPPFNSQWNDDTGATVLSDQEPPKPAPDNGTCGCTGSFNFQSRSRNLNPLGVLNPSRYDFKWYNPAPLNPCGTTSWLQNPGVAVFKVKNEGNKKFLLQGINASIPASIQLNPGQSFTFNVNILECEAANGVNGGLNFSIILRPTCPYVNNDTFAHSIQLLSVSGGHTLTPMPASYGASYSAPVYCP